MAAFSESDQPRLDWELLQDGAVTLFYRVALFEQHIAWLAQHGYAIHAIRCEDVAEFYHQMSDALRFRENFGYEPWTGNLDALNDAFRELDFEPTGGIAFCFHRYDHLKALNAPLAQGVLDILELHSRDNLLLGRRLLALVQSDDPGIHFEPVGARAVSWNRKEWSNKSRGL